MLSRNVSKNHYGFVAITNAKLPLGGLGNDRGQVRAGVSVSATVFTVTITDTHTYIHTTAVELCVRICICKCNQICNGHLASKASVRLSVPSVRTI